MAEYISREVAEELLSEPITMSMCLSKGECLDRIAQREIDLRLIKSIHAADVRPVVYCRECIHWKKSEFVICGNYDMVCDYHIGARYCRHADDFCSKGERRAE